MNCPCGKKGRLIVACVECCGPNHGWPKEGTPPPMIPKELDAQHVCRCNRCEAGRIITIMTCSKNKQLRDQATRLRGLLYD